MTNNIEKPFQFCQEACDLLNDGLGCAFLGWFYAEGLGIKQDLQQAKSYFETSCNLKDAFGCYSLGFLYDNGQGVRQNFQTAKEYYGKACDLGEQDGCDNYRKLNEKGY
ncbi:tetratricopeptide repeat protein [Succinimonas amylolytica]|uniref:tetratricopeptide repeat protein n=1 Tax=Succinimonas amylolytica TaxID=83769 RepID=UPI00037315A0|nr:tetratricopeptide repeat protein [Succinimonas amylolytica]